MSMHFLTLCPLSTTAAQGTRQQLHCVAGLQKLLRWRQVRGLRVRVRLSGRLQEVRAKAHANPRGLAREGRKEPQAN